MRNISSFPFILAVLALSCTTCVFSQDYLCFTAEKDSSYVCFNVQETAPTYFDNFFVVSLTDTMSWMPIKLSTDTIFLFEKGDKAYLKATELRNSLMVCRVLSGEINFVASFSFRMSGSISATGNIMSLLDPTCKMDIIPTSSVGCFANLFKNCTSLTTPPYLPSLELSSYCYYGMFEGCTNLYSAPAISAYKLNTSCCERMFYGCSSLPQSPILYAYTLISKCYKEMFAMCSSMSKITVFFTNWLDNLEATASWTQGVPLDRGNFIAPPHLKQVSGSSNIPLYWTFNALNTNFFRVVALENCSASILLHTGNGSAEPHVKYSKNGGLSWAIYTIGTNIPLNKGDSLCFSASTLQDAFSTQNNVYNLFVRPATSSSISDILSPIATVKGNLMFLLDPLAYSLEIHTPFCFKNLFDAGIYNFDALQLPATLLAPYCYQNMFSNCAFLSSMPALPAKNLQQGCYEGMFSNCKNLQVVQRLPATTLSSSCYSKMFLNCTSLTTVPHDMLPALSVANQSYSMMFARCTQLKNCPTLPATTLAYACYASMFEFDSLLINLPDLPSEKMCVRAYEYMFSYCNSITTTMLLPAKYLADSCYLGMFANCKNLISSPAQINADTAFPYCCHKMFFHDELLTDPPTLNPKVLSEYCYADMFYRCRDLEKAPILPSSMLIQGCYNNMFAGCINLNSIEVNFNQWTENTTTDWVNTGQIATFGTFKCPAWLDQQYGFSNIPPGWQIDAQNIILYDNADPTQTLQFASSSQISIDTIELHRSFAENYNMISLPFSIPHELWNTTNNPLANAQVYKFTQSAINADTLKVIIEPTYEIIAGQPYMIKWIDNPTSQHQLIFSNVTIEKSAITTIDKIELQHLTIVSNFAPLNYSAIQNKDALLLKDGQNVDAIDSIKNNSSINGFRAYALLTTTAPVSYININTKNQNDNLNDVYFTKNKTSQSKKILQNNHVYIITDNGKCNLLGMKL